MITVVSRRQGRGLLPYDSTESANMGFNPAHYGAIRLWVPADKLSYADGTVIRSCEEYSGNKSYGWAPNGVTVMKNIINGLPVLRFAMTFQQFVSFALVSHGAFSCFFVASFRSATNAYNACVSHADTYGSSSSDRGFILALKSNMTAASYIMQDVGTFVLYDGVGSYTLNTPFVFSSIYGSVRKNYKNGTQEGTTSGAISPHHPTNIALVVGGQISMSTRYMDMDLGEIIYFTEALADTPRQQIERHLGAKWGITVA